MKKPALTKMRAAAMLLASFSFAIVSFQETAPSGSPAAAGGYRRSTLHPLCREESTVPPNWIDPATSYIAQDCL